MMNYRHVITKRHHLRFLIFAAVVTAVSYEGFGETISGSEENPQRKIKQLREHSASENNLSSVKSLMLIKQGLTDVQPSVVLEAILQAGNGNVSEVSEMLLDLYNNADGRYPGSQVMIRSRIIAALGKIDNDATRILYKKILSRGNVDGEIMDLFSSISETCGKDLIKSLIEYHQTVTEVLGIIKDTPQNAFRRSQYIRVKSMAQNIINKNSSR